MVMYNVHKTRFRTGEEFCLEILQYYEENSFHELLYPNSQHTDMSVSNVKNLYCLPTGHYMPKTLILYLGFHAEEPLLTE